MILQPFSAYAKSKFIVYTRWQMFLDYLEAHGDEYDQVLVMDTRDAIFQDNVFKEFTACGNYLGYTLEYDDIRGSKLGVDLNYKWLTNYFGKPEADRLAEETIICCGTVIGTVTEMETFIRKMIEYMPNKPFHGIDQATQQYITYNNLLPIDNLIPIDCVTGAILTSYLFHVREPVAVRDNYILRGDGGVPAVVHQYDRSPSLIRLVDTLYRDRNFQPNVRFIDSKSAVEQLYILAKFDRFGDALRFFMAHSFNNMKFTNQDDTLIDILLMTLAENPTAEIETLAIALQYAIADTFATGINLAQINKLYSYVDVSLKARRTVSTAFKDFVANYLFELTKIFMQNNNVPQAVSFIDAAVRLNIPLTSEFYLLQTEIYRKLGRNEESLAAYKKALNLN